MKKLLEKYEFLSKVAITVLKMAIKRLEIMVGELALEYRDRQCHHVTD